MANLYGVDNIAGAPGYTGLIGGANVTVPANTQTNVCDSGLIIAPSNGYFIPVWAGVLLITSGATIPTAFSVGAAIGAGAQYATLTVANNFLLPSSNTMIPIYFVGPSSTVAWQAPGSHCFIQCYASTNGVTAIQSYTVLNFWLARGPDQ